MWIQLLLVRGPGSVLSCRGNSEPLLLSWMLFDISRRSSRAKVLIWSWAIEILLIEACEDKFHRDGQMRDHMFEFEGHV
jgi:hypothetical protein